MFRLLLFGNDWADCAEFWYALGDPLVTAYAVVTGGVPLNVRMCTPRFCISGTARPIMFKFGVWVWSHCEMWYALGDPLVTAYAVATGGVSLHVRMCIVHSALLYLRDGSADCVQVWGVGLESLPLHKLG